MILKELAGQTHQPGRSTSASQTTALSLREHLQGHLGSRVDGRLLVSGLWTTKPTSANSSCKVIYTYLSIPRTYRIAICTLLIKKLLSLSHSHPDELILSTTTTRTACEVFKRLHGSPSAELVGARGATAAATSTTVKPLVLVHGMFLIDALVGNIAVLLLQVVGRLVEEGSTAAPVVLGVFSDAREVRAAGTVVTAVLLVAVRLLSSAVGGLLSPVAPLLLITVSAVRHGSGYDRVDGSVWYSRNKGKEKMK